MLSKIQGKYISDNLNRMSVKEMAKNLKIGYDKVSKHLLENNLESRWTIRSKEVALSREKKNNIKKVDGMFYEKDFNDFTIISNRW